VTELEPTAALVPVAEALDAAIVGVRSVGGGDSSQAWRVELDRIGAAGAAVVFVKTDVVADLLLAEADGLGRLRRSGAVRVPTVISLGQGDAGGFLVLEWIEPGRPVPAHDEELGRSLAALHRQTAPRFGLDRDNFLGRRPQPNRWCDSWVELYGAYRLAPMARLARDAGVLSPELARGVDRLIGRLADLVGPPEPPALVHGDLWAGNAIADASGRPWLVDPAVYYGHREVDLAMMRLFGGFDRDVFAAYADAYPLADGADERLPLHQLYPLLVHTLHPAPAGYVAAVERVVAAYA
jgi:fructosamine-3-kinase